MRLEETSVNGSGQAMREALARKHDWESHGPVPWGYAVASDVLALERRVAALERFSGAGKSAGEDNDSPGVTVVMGTGNTQNDAVPAADCEGTRNKEGSRVRASATPTGNTREPVAWAVMLADNHRIWGVYALEEEANAINDVVAGGHGVVPLYRQPALTAEECEAIELATYDYLYHQDPVGLAQWIREQLLGLLARTK